MKVLDKIRSIVGGGKRSTLRDPDGRLFSSLGASPTNSGIAVNEATALTYAAVYACVRVLAESVASLPLILYERVNDRERRRATDHPLYRLLHDKPNKLQTSFVWRETLQGFLSTWGNAYSEIIRDRQGNVLELRPIAPNRVRPDLDDDGVTVRYVIDGGTILPSDRMFHIPNFGGGVVGYSPIRLAREAIGLGLSAETFGSTFFGSGSRPGGVLQYPGKLTDEELKNIRRSWESMHKGAGNSQKTAILEEGMTWMSVGIPPEDSQFLQTRQFQLQEIARIFRIPAHMVGDNSRSTFNNVEQQSLDFIVHTLRPWCTRWEQIINETLLTPAQRERYYVEHLLDGLLRGDLKSRYEAFSVGIQWGFLSRNDVRQMENLNPFDGGDEYLVPMNMTTNEKLLAEPEPVPAALQVEQAPPPQLEAADEAEDEEEERAIVPARLELRARRETRSLADRQRIITANEELFRGAFERIVAMETKAVGRKASQLLDPGDGNVVRGDQFLEWLTDFYDNQIEPRLVREFEPILMAHGSAVAANVRNELDADDAGDGLSTTLQAFLAAYVLGLAARFVGSSRGQLRRMVLDGAPELLEQLQKRLTDWKRTKASKMAARESAQSGSAIARESYRETGVTRLRWVAFGAETCPICRDLDGKTVGVQQPFAGAGDVFGQDGPEGTKPMTVQRSTFHPPAHEGCVCMILPG